VVNDQAEPVKLSYCESETATSLSPWCLRELTDTGRQFGTGIDTPSFCGRVRAGHGWDLEVEVAFDEEKICDKCRGIAEHIGGI